MTGVQTCALPIFARQGPFDVVHFNNLEGLPVTVLGLKARFPDTRVVLSLHNYYPVCPQVNLWRQERAHCTDFEGGAACETCLPVRPAPRAVRMADGLAYRLKCAGLEPGTWGHDAVFGAVAGLGRSALRGMRALRRGPVQGPVQGAVQGVVQGAAPVSPGSAFAARRAAMVAAVNAGCDAVLCVSDEAVAVVGLGGAGMSLEEVAVYRSEEERRVEHEIEVGDVNSDGYLDVVVLDAGEQMCQILTTSASRNLLEATEFKVFESRLFSRGDSREYEPSELIVGDLTGDGHDDILLVVHDRLIIYPQDRGE